MQKSERLHAIEKILSEKVVTSQEELLNHLEKAGIRCTQATLSRNLRQMGVCRIPDGTGNYRYSMIAGEAECHPSEPRLNFVPVIREIIETKGMMVIKTFPGSAGTAAYYIYNSRKIEIAGTIAGDDTILLIPRDRITLRQVHSCLEMIFPGLHKQLSKTGQKTDKWIENLYKQKTKKK